MSTLFAKVGTSAGSTVEEGRDHFDFLRGRWAVTHRRLKSRLSGDSQWEEFRGACESRPIIGGLGNIDDNLIELPGGAYRAVTLRLFDPTNGLWSIWWVDGRAMRLEPPVQGRFENGTGTFLGDDLLDERPIRVRFIWSEITDDSARWEQAFSPDSGAKWETNWIMNFRRVGDLTE
ncbi:MAG: DUF1579 domain-containing protein [Blastocatellia bacterium]